MQAALKCKRDNMQNGR